MIRIKRCEQFTVNRPFLNPILSQQFKNVFVSCSMLFQIIPKKITDPQATAMILWGANGCYHFRTVWSLEVHGRGDREVIPPIVGINSLVKKLMVSWGIPKAPCLGLWIFFLFPDCNTQRWVHYTFLLFLCKRKAQSKCNKIEIKIRNWK